MRPQAARHVPSTDVAASIVPMFESIDAGRWSRLGEYFHDEVVYVRPGYAPITGIGDLLDFYRNRRIIKSGRHVIESICSSAGGDTWVVTGSFTGVDRCGNGLRARFCDVYSVEAGKIRRRETFFDSPAV